MIIHQVHNYNISLVIPITENGELKEVRVDGNDISYGKLDMIIGRIINLAYSILTENGIQVNNKIVLINNEKYKNFISWFLERYKDRCEYKTYLELITITNNNSISLNKIEMTDINFVIGKEEKDPPQKPKELTNTLELDPNIVIDEIDAENYILDKTTEYSLNLDVTKFYGPDLNERGNFCITGHNARGLFNNLKKLDIGDTFYIIDIFLYLDNLF